MASLARDQLRRARRLRNPAEEEFAVLLTSLLEWPVAADLLRSWETTAVSPGDVLVAPGVIICH
jgi:hypothetical protein